MYFMFAKIVIIYLVMRFLLVDAYTLIVSGKGRFCANFATQHATQLCTFYLSGFNLKSVSSQVYLNVLDILNIVLTLLTMVFFIISRKIITRMQEWLDYADINQEDYSILL